MAVSCPEDIISKHSSPVSDTKTLSVPSSTTNILFPTGLVLSYTFYTHGLTQAFFLTKLNLEHLKTGTHHITGLHT